MNSHSEGVPLQRMGFYRYIPVMLGGMLLTQSVSAQSITAYDSLRLQLSKDSAHIYRPRKVQLLLSLDQRNTFLETSANVNTPVNLQGIRAGLTIHKRQRTGLGIYRVRDSRARISRVNGRPVDVEFRFNYLTGFYEYYFIHTKRWDVGVPVEGGIGRYRATDTSVNRKGILFPMGVGVDVHFKPLRWGSINTMGGYRYVGNNNNLVKLSNWFYAFGISLNTRNIYDDSRYRLKKRKFRKEAAKLRAET